MPNSHLQESIFLIGVLTPGFLLPKEAAVTSHCPKSCEPDEASLQDTTTTLPWHQTLDDESVHSSDALVHAGEALRCEADASAPDFTPEPPGSFLNSPQCRTLPDSLWLAPPQYDAWQSKTLHATSHTQHSRPQTRLHFQALLLQHASVDRLRYSCGCCSLFRPPSRSMMSTCAAYSCSSP